MNCLCLCVSQEEPIKSKRNVLDIQINWDKRDSGAGGGFRGRGGPRGGRGGRGGGFGDRERRPREDGDRPPRDREDRGHREDRCVNCGEKREML